VQVGGERLARRLRVERRVLAHHQGRTVHWAGGDAVQAGGLLQDFGVFKTKSFDPHEQVARRVEAARSTEMTRYQWTDDQMRPAQNPMLCTPRAGSFAATPAMAQVTFSD
jgi:hypothetical protein